MGWHWCRFVQPPARYQVTLREHGHKYSVLHGLSVFTQAFTISVGTYCANPQRDGQAELTRVAGYILRWVTHPSTNLAQCSATALIETITSKPCCHFD